MSIFQAVILGTVQGLTEFLPVSSSGHLVLLQRILGITADAVLFDTALHLGTLVSVFFVMRKECADILKHPFSAKWGLLAVSTLPAVAAALLLGDMIDAAFTGDMLFMGFLLTALVLFISDRISLRSSRTSSEVNYKNALTMGVMQAFAVLPGLSRSGAAAAGGLLSSLDRKTSVDFAMLMSIPAILGSLVYNGAGIISEGLDSSLILPCIIGAACAALSGCVSVKVMLSAVKKRRLTPFIVYTGALGAFLLADKLFFGLI